MSESYDITRGRLEAYFDGTANDQWKRLMSDAPVSRIRQTVRAGRDRMRATLLALLPEDLSGLRILDAGCGSGQMSMELARRGAEVLGVDISPKLLEVAQRQLPEPLQSRVSFVAADMLDARLGTFDHAVAMDSLIHYRPADIASALSALSQRTRRSVVFTVAPQTPLLSLMYVTGKLFPRADRSPAIAPVSAAALRRRVAALPDLASRELIEQGLVNSGFYISRAMELRSP